MTNEQKQMSIAEDCGWKQCSIAISQGIVPHKAWRKGSEQCVFELPYYLNDLNAMHEAEKCLDVSLWDTYIDILTTQVVHKNAADLDGSARDRNMAVVCATAAQRAEAFLLTIGKNPL